MLHRLLILCAALLAGCSTAPGTRPVPEATSNPSAEAIVQAELLAGYARALQTVVKGSPTEQAEILDEARRGYEQARQGPAALRLGLLLAAPEHPSRNPQDALRMLREAMARSELLSPVERALAVVETARVEQELGLNAENARLVAEAQERERQRNAPSTTAALTRQLKAESDENARLRKELEEARAKLEAIANIERSNSTRRP